MVKGRGSTCSGKGGGARHAVVKGRGITCSGKGGGPRHVVKGEGH